MKKTILFLSAISIIICSVAAQAAKFPSRTIIKPLSSILTPQPGTDSADASLTVTAVLAENVGVIKIVLFYRAIGSKAYKSETMHADQNGEYRYIIHQAEIDTPKLEYYIKATKFDGHTLLHGNANLPLIAHFEDGQGNNTSIAGTSGQNHSGNAKDPMWKNKWLWVGVGVLAAAAIANNSGGGNDSDSKPGFSLVIEAPQPEPAVP